MCVAVLNNEVGGALLSTFWDTVGAWWVEIPLLCNVKWALAQQVRSEGDSMNCLVKTNEHTDHCLVLV